MNDKALISNFCKMETGTENIYIYMVIEETAVMF